jgi:transglutaminase-like putative cysteine protease
MKPRSRLHFGLLLLVLVNMLPIVEAEASWYVLVIALAGAIGSWFAYESSGEPYIPRWAVHSCVFMSLGFLLFEMFAPHEEPTVYILDLAHFMVFLSVCKFYELRTHRDIGVVVLIMFLLVIIGGFASASLLYALALVVDLTLGVAWLIAFQQARDIAAIDRRRQQALGDRGGARQNGAPSRIGVPALLRLAPAYALLMTGIAAMIFIAVPRGWGRNIFGGMRHIIPISATGITDQVSLHPKTIIEDQSPVMRVRFSRGGRSILDKDFKPYMRGHTYDRYHLGRWRRTPMGVSSVYHVGQADDPTPLSEAARAMPVDSMLRQEVWLDTAEDGMLFAVYPPLYFASSDVERIVQDQKDLSIQTGDQADGTARYAVFSSDELPPSLSLTMEFRPLDSRDGPSDIPPRVARFARSFAIQYGDPSDREQHAYIAAKMAEYLSSGEFEYTLNRSMTHINSDPVTDFLFENRSGHCEFFASAMTVLCQAVGIRARLVGGYYGGEVNQAGGFYQFRRSDAHAWVEVFSPRRGWVSFDPSPIVEADASAEDESLLARLRRLKEYLQFRWSLFIVSFDSQSRSDVVERFGTWLRSLEQVREGSRSTWALTRTFLRGPAFLTTWQRVLYWICLVLCTVFVVLVLRALWLLSMLLRESLLAGRKTRRRLIRRPEARFYDRLLLLLARKGHRKPEHQTPREFAGAVVGAYPELADVRAFTEWFYEIQYGGEPLGDDRWQRVSAVLQRLREDPAFGARRKTKA